MQTEKAAGQNQPSEVEKPSVVIDITCTLAATLLCWVLPKCSRVTTQKTTYELEPIFLATLV